MPVDKSTWPPFFRDLYGDNGTPFRGARIKIMRAEHHLEELAIAARVIPQSIPQKFAVGIKPDKVNLWLMVERLPLQFSASVGDVVHNLRCALDFTAVALTAPPIGTGNPKRAYFPSGLDEPSYRTERADKMANAHPMGLALVDGLEPWRGGKFGIRELHELDIRDKHKLLVPSFAPMTIQSLAAVVRGEPVTITQADFKGSGQSFSAELNCPGVKTPDDFKFAQEFRATFKVVFGPGQPFASLEVVPTLIKLKQTVLSMIDKCEQTFPGYVSWTAVAPS